MILVYQLGTTDMDHLFRAVARRHPVVGTRQELSALGFALGRICVVRQEPFPMVRVDVPRGYGRKFFWAVRPRLRSVRKWCEDRFGQKVGVVVLTIPHLAPLAQDFRDALRVFYVCDDFRAYGWGEGFVDRRQREMVAAVDHVFCVSNELRRRFISEYGVPEDRCHLSPNAAMAEQLLPAPLDRPADLPPEAAGLARPIAGMIGNLTSSDFVFLAEVAQGAPWMQWLLVGPMGPCCSADQEEARRRFLRLPGVRHVGPQPHERLYEFARSFDVGWIAYDRVGTVPFGSAVRLYIHMAATRPVISNRACLECEEHGDVVHLVGDAREAVQALLTLRDAGFDDGRAAARWDRARRNTWDVRATKLLDIVGKKGAVQQ